MSARTEWTATPMPAVIVPAAVGADLAAQLRASFTDYVHFPRIDEASYDVIDAPAIPDVLEILTGVASEVTGRPLKLARARVLRLRPGDYILVRHDRVYEDRPVEAVLDLSAAPVSDAEVHWRHRGQVYFTMPSSPCALALVERGPTVLANHTYVSKRGTSDVVRLVAIFHEG